MRRKVSCPWASSKVSQIKASALVQETLICWIAHSEREYMNLSDLVTDRITYTRERFCAHWRVEQALVCAEAKRSMGSKLLMI
ncbi:MAG TPA: hypothetical protein DHV63_13275 [Pseudomonas sp.]|nr:hypothetical protein [Pseudomonas sp.]